ncbi:MAG TPA: glycosyltransferase family 4 protein [Terriglobia bacterium]|nr:glycosyltransferase family 4 protein [Terriglobia bacterium]
MPIRVLIYTHAFAPSIGGVETYVMLLAQGLAREAAGVQVTVATPTPAGNCDDAALPFHVVRRPGFATLLKLLWRADIIHVAGPCLLPMSLGWLLRKRVVVEHHGYQTICPNGNLLQEPSKAICPGHFMAGHYRKCFACHACSVGRPRSALDLLLVFPRRWACGRVALNLPITDHVNRRVRLPRSKVVHYGIPDAPHSVEEQSQNTGDFAYVGRMVSEKGLHLLIDAARQLQDAGCVFHLTYVGDGPERPALEERVKALGLRNEVTFTGYLQGEALEHALRQVDALVMPSIWEETAGLSAIEQMMRGRLVIASDTGGLGEVVDGAGLKFAVGDVKGLTSCLRRVLDEPSLVKSLGEKARERALQLFRLRRMVADHLAVYRDLASH